MKSSEVIKLKKHWKNQNQGFSHETVHSFSEGAQAFILSVSSERFWDSMQALRTLFFSRSKRDPGLLDGCVWARLYAGVKFCPATVRIFFSQPKLGVRNVVGQAMSQTKRFRFETLSVSTDCFHAHPQARPSRANSKAPQTNKQIPSQHQSKIISEIRRHSKIIKKSYRNHIQKIEAPQNHKQIIRFVISKS